MKKICFLFGINVSISIYSKFILPFILFQIFSFFDYKIRFELESQLEIKGSNFPLISLLTLLFPNHSIIKLDITAFLIFRAIWSHKIHPRESF